MISSAVEILVSRARETGLRILGPEEALEARIPAKSVQKNLPNFSTLRRQSPLPQVE